ARPPTRRCRRRRDSPRCSRKRWRRTRSAAKSTTITGCAPPPKKCVRRRRAGLASARVRKIRDAPSPTDSSGRFGGSRTGRGRVGGTGGTGRKMISCPSPPSSLPALPDLDQLDIEHEQAERRPLVFVGKLLGNPEARFLAFHHQLHAFGPPCDDAVERKRHWL